MAELHETNSIKVEVEVEGNKLTIITEIKDEEVFSPIDWDNKKIRARLTDQIADQMKGLLSQRLSAKSERKGKMANVMCIGCGKPFEVEIPCCGKKMEQVTCTNCGKVQMLKMKDKK